MEILFTCKMLPVGELHPALNDCVIVHVVHELQITGTNDQAWASDGQAGIPATLAA